MIRSTAGARRFGATSVVAAIALGVMLLMAALHPAPVFANSYSMPHAVIDATVNADGSMDVTEQRTFSFDGDYTFVYWDLRTFGSNGITVTSVTGPGGQTYVPTTDPNATDTRPPGTYLLTNTGSSIEVRAFFRLSDTDAPNVVDLLFKPGARVGDSCRIETQPRTTYFTLLNHSRTVAAGSPRFVRLQRELGQNLIHVTGQLPVNGTNWVDAVRFTTGRSGL